MVRAILVPRSEFVQYRALRALRGPALEFERHLAGRSVVPEGLPTTPPECAGCEHSFAGWQSRTFVNFATFHHELDLLHCLDVLGWITSHGRDVSKEAWCEPATVLNFQQLRSSNRGALDRLHGCHAACDQRHEFAPRIVLLQGPVRREGNLHSRLNRLLVTELRSRFDFRELAANRRLEARRIDATTFDHETCLRNKPHTALFHESDRLRRKHSPVLD